MATPAFSNQAHNKISTTKTLSLTVNAGEVLYAFISKGGSDTPTATWNGGAMSVISTNNTQGRHQTLFGLSSPTTGTSNVVFSTTQTQGTIVAFTISGANSTPTGQINNTQTATSTTISGSVTLTYSNSMVIICTFADNAPTITTGGSQVDIYKQADGTSQSGAASYYIPNSAGAITMSYTLSASGDWEPIIFEVVAATPITPNTVGSMFHFFYQ